MSVLKAMNPSSFAGYREAAARGYAVDNVASGRWPKEGALQRSYEDFDESLPQGLATPDNYLYEIRSETTSATVGVIWFAVVVKNGLKSAFVYDVEVKAEFRRQGHARAALAALEPLVKALGLSSIGLHVFGHNPGAQGLYNSLGYRITGVNMLKELGKGAALYRDFPFSQGEFAFLVDRPRRFDEQAALTSVNEEQTASLQTALLHAVDDLACGPGYEPLSGAPLRSPGSRAFEPPRVSRACPLPV